MKKLSLIGCSLGLLLLAAPGAVRADGVASPSIHSLVQEGQDVRVTISIEGGDVFYLTLKGKNQKEWTVFENRDFSKEKPSWTYSYCLPSLITDGGSSDCDASPQDCEDCNGDQIPECHGDCFATDYYEVMDSCVLPGKTNYSLYFQGEENAFGTQDIDVKDTGDPCLSGDAGPDAAVDAGADVDADTDADGDADGDVDDVDSGQGHEDKGSSGCNVWGAGHQGSGYGAFMILLGIGLAAMLAGWRKERT